MADQENQKENQKENLVIDFNSSSTEGYSSDDSLYSSSNMFGYHSDSSVSESVGDDEHIDSAELESMKAPSKTDAPVAQEFIQSLIQEQKGKSKMPEVSPKKKIPDPKDLAEMWRKNKGIVIRENAETAVSVETANNEALSAVQSLRDFWRETQAFRHRSKKPSGKADGGGDDSTSPPPFKKAKLTSLAEYAEKVKAEPLFDSVPAPEPEAAAPVDRTGLKSDLRIELEELMNKGPEFMDEIYAKILVHLLQRMPVCITRGGIPEGRITKGFLFRVDPVEGPKIICSCHGEFFEAAGFVVHAGGEADVRFPARFIHLEFF